MFSRFAELNLNEEEKMHNRGVIAYPPPTHEASYDDNHKPPIHHVTYPPPTQGASSYDDNHKPPLGDGTYPPPTQGASSYDDNHKPPLGDGTDITFCMFRKSLPLEVIEKCRQAYKGNGGVEGPPSSCIINKELHLYPHLLVQPVGLYGKPITEYKEPYHGPHDKMVSYMLSQRSQFDLDNFIQLGDVEDEDFIFRGGFFTPKGPKYKAQIEHVPNHPPGPFHFKEYEERAKVALIWYNDNTQQKEIYEFVKVETGTSFPRGAALLYRVYFTARGVDSGEEVPLRTEVLFGVGGVEVQSCERVTQSATSSQ